LCDRGSSDFVEFKLTEGVICACLQKCLCSVGCACVSALLLMSCNQRQQKRPQVPSAESGQQYIYGKLNSTITTHGKPAGRQSLSPTTTHTHTHWEGERKVKVGGRWGWYAGQCVVSCRHCDFYCRRHCCFFHCNYQL